MRSHRTRRPLQESRRSNSPWHQLAARPRQNLARKVQSDSVASQRCELTPDDTHTTVYKPEAEQDAFTCSAQAKWDNLKREQVAVADQHRQTEKLRKGTHRRTITNSTMTATQLEVPQHLARCATESHGTCNICVTARELKNIFDEEKLLVSARQESLQNNSARQRCQTWHSLSDLTGSCVPGTGSCVRMALLRTSSAFQCPARLDVRPHLQLSTAVTVVEIG